MRSVEELGYIIDRLQNLLIDEGVTYAEASTIISELYARHLIARTAQVLEDRRKSNQQEVK